MCPSAQVTQRCEWVSVNSSAISGAHALVPAYGTNVKVHRQLHAAVSP